MRALLLATIVAGGIAHSAVAAPPEPGSRPTREFVQAAGQSDTFEVLEGRTILAETRDPQIRAFAEQMIRDHGRTAATLRQATARSGLRPPPMSLASDQSGLLAALQSLRGHDLDEAYLRHQALAHRAALTVEQGYAASGDDPAVRQAATSAVPLIASHLDMVERMRAAAGDR